MTMYSRSDAASVNVGPAHGGCGRPHAREAGPDGRPVSPWGVDCPGACEDYLASDPHWSKTVSEIPETYDEKKAREDFGERGSRDRDALLAMALARMSGLGPLEIPRTVRHMITGAGPHIPGQMICPAGHANTPGNRFCGQCGQPVSGTAAAAALGGGAGVAA